MKQRLLSVASACVLASLISACVGVAPTRLSPSAKVAPLYLDETFEFSVNAPGGQKMRGYIAAGSYQPVAIDEDGIYYLGPKECYRLIYLDPGWLGSRENINKTWRVTDCGVFVPNDAKGFAMGFAVQGSDLTMDQLRTYEPRQEQREQSQMADVPLTAYPAAPAGTSPLQAGLGYGLGMGLVSVLASAEVGRYVLIRNQEESTRLRSSLRTVRVN